MKVYTPASNYKILHKSTTGEVYRLDSFDNPLRLRKSLLSSPDFSVIDVAVTNIEAAENLILQAHTPQLLYSYKTGEEIDKYNQTGILYQKDFYDFVLESALIAQMVYQEANSTGKAFALAGGGHHAERNIGFGFCPINTIAIAALEALKHNKKVSIIDLDVHFSNGVFDILKDQEGVYCTNIWGKIVDKWKYTESKGNIWHRKVENKLQYFEQLNYLFEQVDRYNPEYIIYHLGLDVLSTDRMGGIEGFNEDSLHEREERLKEFFKTGQYKFSIFRGGSYVNYNKTQEEIAKQKESITNLQFMILENYNY